MPYSCSPAQAKEYAEKMLGHKLITKQTGAGGRLCNAVMLAERMPPQKEYYAAVLPCSSPPIRGV
jgi:succinyl-CoA synthetase beta subunit